MTGLPMHAEILRRLATTVGRRNIMDFQQYYQAYRCHSKVRIYCNSTECFLMQFVHFTGSLFSTGQPFPSAAIANSLNCRPSTSITPNSLQAHGLLANGATGGQVANGTLSNGVVASSTMSVASPATPPPQYYTCTQEGQVSAMSSVQLQVRSATSPATFVANGGTPAASDGVCYPPNSCIRPLQPPGMTWVPPVHPHLYKATPDTPPATPCTAYSSQLPPTPPQQSAAAITGTSTPGAERMHAQWAPSVNSTGSTEHVGYGWQMEVRSEENGSTAEENYYDDSPSNISLCRWVKIFFFFSFGVIIYGSMVGIFYV